MAKRRRARRRGDPVQTDAAPREERHRDRDAQRARAAFAASQQRLSRRRTIVGALGFIPLAASLVPCVDAPPPLALFCGIPREYWLLIWAAIFGSFLGLTIRLILERRRFTRGTWGQRSA